MGSLGESTFGDPLWAEVSPVSVQNVSKMWLPRVPDGFLFFSLPGHYSCQKELKKGVPRGGVFAVLGHFLSKKNGARFFQLCGRDLDYRVLKTGFLEAVCFGDQV